MVRLLALLALSLAAPAFAQPVTPEALRVHVEMLASDAFEGREPGTEGERKTIAYLAAQLRSYGVEPAAGGGSWYQPLTVEVRRPGEQKALFRGRRKKDSIVLDRDRLLLLGRGVRERIDDAPVYFAGHGTLIPGEGVDQLGRADLKGAVVLIYQDGIDAPGFPTYAERVKAVAARGAAAVIGIAGPELAWPMMQRVFERGQRRIAIDPPAPVQGAIPLREAERLIRAARGDLRMLNAEPGRSFTPVRLDLRADLDVTTELRTIPTHNVVGRLKGSGGSAEAILYLAHWDHLGICQPEGAVDRICNGAVDNASGLAVLLEVARALGRGPRPKRDIVFLATTAEEMGLLGAAHFAARPTLPLKSILAAINLDTVAIAPRGEKVAVMGRGLAPLDAAIDATVAQLGRTLDEDDEASALVQRQDGWALARAGVPAIMVGGSFSDMKRLGAFLQGPYHHPEDNPGPHLELGGAAEDADLLIALGRRLADPARYAPDPRP